MGGLGSGAWPRFGRKRTAEESLDLPVRAFRGRLYDCAAGTFTWTWRGGHKASTGYVVTRDEGGDVVTLLYRRDGSAEVRLPVRLTTTPAGFGGVRWWFTCPLAARGVACRRRIGKLFLPPGATYFGCRQCHGLTYRSSQEAHQIERIVGRLGLDPVTARAWAAQIRNEK